MASRGEWTRARHFSPEARFVPSFFAELQNGLGGDEVLFANSAMIFQQVRRGSEACDGKIYEMMARMETTVHGKREGGN